MSAPAATCRLNFRLTEREARHLASIARATARSKSEVLRTLIIRATVDAFTAPSSHATTKE